MSKWARMKSKAGQVPTPLTSAATINVPNGSDSFSLTGTATLTSLLARVETIGRICHFYQASGITTFTNSPGTTTAGQMDLGALDSSNLVLGPTDSVDLQLRSDRTWIRVNVINN